jgi:signal transduction histidine kinase/HPt (histidine-containing phosphotransfer) domain-containing protein
MPQKNGFVKATKGKVILALFLACFALFIAWSISKVVFQEMLVTVNGVSAPSKRLNLVNAISRKISSLDQQQKKQAIKTPGNYNKLFKESLALRKMLDSLANLYPQDSVQVKRLKIIKTLLVERDKQFLDYLRVRASLVNNQSFSSQVKSLNALVSKASAGDSTVLATEERTSTTTFSPQEKKPRSFFGKLFGKKKEEQDKSFTIISERKIKRDTIALSAEEAIAKSVESSLRNIEKGQQQRNNSFIDREARLANANGVLISQMLALLTKVENEVVNQIDSTAIQAKEVVNSGITRITLVMVVFFLITVVLLWLILTDITRSNRYRQDLEIAKDEAEYHGQAKQRFLANMSHEIRTPLQSIIGYSELLVNDERYNEHHVRAISQSSEHLLQIVNEVLDYNRIISGKFTFDKRPFDMSELLNEVISVIRPQAAAKSLLLIADFDINRLGMLEGDGFRLKQILLNLLGNAIKFTESGQITFSVEYKVRRNQAYFTFTIRDTGVGMSEADAKIVFNEFEQSKSIQREVSNQDGAGLGLTIVKALVENQNGRIYLKSKIGKGTVFTVFLAFDIIEVASNSANEEALTVRLPSGTVWIIDDDPLILNLCEIIFTANQIPFKSFRSPLAVLKEPINEDLSYILMDMRMPEMDGIALCRRLRDKISTNVEIIAMTAQVIPSEQGDILNKGFDALLMKPFKKQDLLEMVSDQLEINLDSLKKMTLDDPVLLDNIIQGFCKDCVEDRGLIFEALRLKDWEAVTLVIHRLAGRIAQIGIAELAVNLRQIELRLREGKDESKESLKKDIMDTLTQINIVVEMFESKRLAYSIS